MADTPPRFKPFSRPKWTGVQPLAEIVPGLLDPVLQKRAGLTTAIVAAWPEMAGAALAQGCMPLKIVWGRAEPMAGESAPATLVIAADPAVALAVQHSTGPLIARINAFFGYRAIDRLRIVQKTVAKPPRHAPPPVPDANQTRKALGMVAGIEDEGLRASLAQLGANVLAKRARER